jgi:hypothetical protein
MQEVSQKDLLDAIEHADFSLDQDWELKDFKIRKLGMIPLKMLHRYDDMSWLDLLPEDFEGMSTEERLKELEDFRGPKWAQMARKWLKEGIPPIVIISAPSVSENELYTQIGDGRGRVNFAHALGIKRIPVVHMIYRHVRNLNEEKEMDYEQIYVPISTVIEMLGTEPLDESGTEIINNYSWGPEKINEDVLAIPRHLTEQWKMSGPYWTGDGFIELHDGECNPTRMKKLKEAHQRGPIGASMDAEDDAGIPNMIIDLGSHRAGKLDESWLTMFGEATKLLMKGLMGNFSVPVKVKGTPSEISSFSGALSKEKKYLQAISKYGLNDPRTYKNKGKLDKAISQFQRTTGLKWPFQG